MTSGGPGRYHPAVFAEAPGFDREELTRAVRTGWGITAVELSYVPVGFGTHHYRLRAGDGSDWFVNVDEVAAKVFLGQTPTAVLAGLERALATAAALRAAGLEFVHAPRPVTAGGFVVPLAGGYAVSLVPFLDGISYPYGPFPTAAERHAALAAVGRLHAVIPTVPATRETLEVPRRDETLDAIAHLDQAWTGGPYSERAQTLLRERLDRVDDLFARYDLLVGAVLSTSDTWVVTHGEPHAGNVMRTADGFRLIDWDTVAIGPRERDLWMLDPNGEADLAAYGGDPPDPAAMEAYRLLWTLGEICGYTLELRAPHRDDANTQVSWRSLQGYLS
jgi:spectinomycin phosphotransferase